MRDEATASARFRSRLSVPRASSSMARYGSALGRSVDVQRLRRPAASGASTAIKALSLPVRSSAKALSESLRSEGIGQWS
jgi:hypothetical protein